eukprot:gnl/MRDRNA2_/MRDRNA2_16971_c0_seq1.p1 gnl/MRDRNA2_/MRDRNA2_16971_c0~~gnl/MRDRNA2_/MRDRNA2_16971_c0_seq1.p1  ORF type:complete len:588 (+),score=103.53 gnl/MRDRNA2_/MRDRNA2_16971_c0_seq1:152-1765(+)
MCLAIFSYEEEPSFWVFCEMLENVLGVPFFAKWPPLLGYHALTAVILPLISRACPALSQALGEELGDVAAMLGCKFFIPCFVGHLPAPVLVALWCDLLLGTGTDGSSSKVCPHYQPLVTWFFGLLRYLEPELLKEVENHPDPDFPKAPTIFQAVVKQANELPADWRPKIHQVFASATDFFDLVDSEQKRILAEAQDKQLVSKSGIPPHQVKTLHQEFLSLPGEEGGGIGLATLRTVLWRIAPRHVVEESSTRLFELLDRDNSGSLDFFELMTGILVLCEGSRSQKLRLIFSLYDTDGSGYLDKDELLCLAQALVKLSGVTAEDAWTGMVGSPGSLGSSSGSCGSPVKATPRKSIHVASPSFEEERLERLERGRTPSHDEIEKVRPRSADSMDPDRLSFPRLSDVEHRRWSHDLGSFLGLGTPKKVSSRLRRASVYADIAQCITAEQFRRRLLLLDTSGMGRVSLDDFLMGAPCDETVCRCLAQVGIGITEETDSSDLPGHLSDSSFRFEIEDASLTKHSTLDRGQRCLNCVKQCSVM